MNLERTWVPQSSRKCKPHLKPFVDGKVFRYTGLIEQSTISKSIAIDEWKQAHHRQDYFETSYAIQDVVAKLIGCCDIVWVQVQLFLDDFMNCTQSYTNLQRLFCQTHLWVLSKSSLTVLDWKPDYTSLCLHHHCPQIDQWLLEYTSLKLVPLFQCSNICCN